MWCSAINTLLSVIFQSKFSLFTEGIIFPSAMLLFNGGPSVVKCHFRRSNLPKSTWAFPRLMFQILLRKLLTKMIAGRLNLSHC